MTLHVLYRDHPEGALKGQFNGVETYAVGNEMLHFGNNENPAAFGIAFANIATYHLTMEAPIVS